MQFAAGFLLGGFLPISGCGVFGVSVPAIGGSFIGLILLIGVMIWLQLRHHTSGFTAGVLIALGLWIIVPLLYGVFYWAFVGFP